MNKRGVEERLYLWAFYLLLIVILTAIFLSYINQEAKGEAFNKRYLARDIALLVNTLYASPGDISVKYSFEEGVYSVSIGEIDNKYKVRVNTVTGIIKKILPLDYAYAEDLFYDTRLKADLGRKYGVNCILFEKEDNDAFVKECKIEEK